MTTRLIRRSYLILINRQNKALMHNLGIRTNFIYFYLAARTRYLGSRYCIEADIYKLLNSDQNTILWKKWNKIKTPSIYYRINQPASTTIILTRQIFTSTIVSKSILLFIAEIAKILNLKKDRYVCCKHNTPKNSGRKLTRSDIHMSESLTWNKKVALAQQSYLNWSVDFRYQKLLRKNQE